MTRFTLALVLVLALAHPNAFATTETTTPAAPAEQGSTTTPDGEKRESVSTPISEKIAKKGKKRSKAPKASK